MIQESLPCNDNTVTRNVSDKPAYIEVLAGMQDSFGIQKQQVRSKPSFFLLTGLHSQQKKSVLQHFFKAIPKPEADWD